MEINIHLHHGPLDVEIQADKEDDYQQEVLDVLEFIQENQEQFSQLTTQQAENEQSTEYDQAPADSEIWEEAANTDDSDRQDTNQIWAPVSRATGVDESILERMFDMPENEEQVPAIVIEEFEDGIDSLGGSRRERQAQASLMLLYIWHEIRGVDKVPSSDLADALNMSGVDSANMYAMYDALGGDADAYFNRTSGGNPTVKLSRRGKRVASNQIETFTECLS
jgi:hypothetical protein